MVRTVELVCWLGTEGLSNHCWASLPVGWVASIAIQVDGSALVEQNGVDLGLYQRDVSPLNWSKLKASSGVYELSLQD